MGKEFNNYQQLCRVSRKNLSRKFNDKTEQRKIKKKRRKIPTVI